MTKIKIHTPVSDCAIVKVQEPAFIRCANLSHLDDPGRLEQLGNDLHYPKIIRPFYQSFIERATEQVRRNILICMDIGKRIEKMDKVERSEEVGGANSNSTCVQVRNKQVSRKDNEVTNRGFRRQYCSNRSK
jgi:hypothetical protein